MLVMGLEMDPKKEKKEHGLNTQPQQADTPTFTRSKKKEIIFFNTFRCGTPNKERKDSELLRIIFHYGVSQDLLVREY